MVIAGICAIPFVLGAAGVLLGESMPVGLLLILGIIISVVSFIARLALFDAVVEEGEPAGGVGGAYQKGLRFLIPSLWVSGLVALTALGGLFLALVPGVLLSLWLSLSLYVLFAENRRGVLALVSSWHYVKGYLDALFWRFLFFALVVLLIGLLFALVTSGSTILIAVKSGTKPEPSSLSQLINLIFNNFFVFPLSIIYGYGIYRSLKDIKASVALAAADETKTKRAIVIFSIIGIIGIIAIIAFAGFLLVKVLPFLPQFSPQLQSPTSLHVSVSSMLSSLAFSPLLNFLSFGR